LEQARDKLAEVVARAEGARSHGGGDEGEPFDLEVELGGVPGEVARWLNPLVLRVLRCE
jgi:hypothetical protein